MKMSKREIAMIIEMLSNYAGRLSNGRNDMRVETQGNEDFIKEYIAYMKNDDAFFDMKFDPTEKHHYLIDWAVICMMAAKLEKELVDMP